MSNWDDVYSYAGALYNVYYDKAYEYLSGKDVHHVSRNKIDDVDSLDKYKDVINVPIEDENFSTRIFEETSMYNQLGTFFSEPTEIIDTIFLGSALNASMTSELRKNNIKLIINMTSELSNYNPDEFKYYNYPLKDNNSDSIYPYLENAFQKIQEHQQNDQGNILIHCHMGRSRSVILVLYYLIRTKKTLDGNNYTIKDAIEFVKEKRPFINPSMRLIKDLARALIDRENDKQMD